MKILGFIVIMLLHSCSNISHRNVFPYNKKIEPGGTLKLSFSFKKSWKNEKLFCKDRFFLPILMEKNLLQLFQRHIFQNTKNLNVE